MLSLTHSDKENQDEEALHGTTNRVWVCGGSLPVAELERISTEHGLPKRIQVDNGPEFISKDLDRWAYWKKVELDFSRPGKPTDNALVESINSRFRQECLNQHWFMSLEDAQLKIETWRHDYNHQRPHSSLGYRPPAEFASEINGAEMKVA